MRKIFVTFVLIVIALSVLALNYNFLYSKITGLATQPSIDVSIKQKINGKLLLTYQPLLEIGLPQNIYAEFINTGTDPVTARIEEKIYTYANGTLKLLAYYYDVSVPLGPGERRGYSTVLVPPAADLYYIQARGYYSTKIVEVWGAFSVYYPPPTITILPSPPPAAPAPIIKTPDMTLSYPDSVKLRQGETKLIEVRAINSGGITLNSLRLDFSATNLMKFNVNPKQVASLDFGEVETFLVSVEVPSTMPEGVYPFDFEVVSDEIKRSGSISMEVSAAAVSEEAEIRETILHDEYLITEMNGKISSAASQGYDVTLANQSLDNARSNLKMAKYYLDLGNFAEAKNKLNEVNKNLEDTVFQLASAKMYVYKVPAYVPFLIPLIIIVIIILAVSIYYYNKKRKERPRLLRALTEEGETEK